MDLSPAAPLGPRRYLFAWAAVLATVVWSLWELRATLLPVSYLDDASVHEQMVRFATARLRGGFNPFTSWFPYLQQGSPQFLHYQSLPATLTGLLGLAIGPDTAFRWTLYLLWCLWPIAVYGSARLLRLGRFEAAVAAVVSPLLASVPGVGYEQKGYIWIGYGVWTQLFAMWTLPFAWATTWRAMENKRFIAPATVCIALTAAFHFETGYLAIIPLALMPFVVFTDLKARLARAATLLVTSGLAVAWVVLPLLMNSNWAAINQPLLHGPLENGYGARTVLTWLVTGRGFDNMRFPSVTILVGAGLLIAIVSWYRRKESRLLIVLFALGLALAFGRTTFGPLVDVIPGSTDVFFRRFFMAAQLSGIYLTGVGAVGLTTLLTRALAAPMRNLVFPPQVPAGISAGTLTATGLDPAGLDPAGLDAAGLHPAGLDPAGLGSAGLDPAGLGSAGLDTPPLDPAAPGGDPLAQAVPETVPASALPGDPPAKGRLAGWPAARKERLSGLAPLALAGVLGAVLLGPAWTSMHNYDALNVININFQREAESTQAANIGPIIDYIRQHGDGRVYAGSPSDFGTNYTVGSVSVFKYLEAQDLDEVGYTLRTAGLMDGAEFYFDDYYKGDYAVFGIRYLIFPASFKPPKDATFVMQRGIYRLWVIDSDSYIRVVDTVGTISENRGNIGTQSEKYLQSRQPGNDIDYTVDYPHLPAAAPTSPGRRPAGTPGVVLNESADMAAGQASATVEMTRRAVVVLSASYDPGWHAFVDGKPAQTEMLEPAVVGVVVGAGRHTVTFRYYGYRWYGELWALTFLDIVGAFVISFWAGPAFWRRRRDRRVVPAVALGPSGGDVGELEPVHVDEPPIGDP